MAQSIHELAVVYGKTANEYREWLHRHAELSFEEKESAAFIRNKLNEFGVEILSGFSGNSTVGVLEGEEPGPVIAFRADIDALPVCENNDLPYKSENEGVMHACGHDAHAATLLGFAKLLSEHRKMIRGKVKFIFQQGEEKFPGGASILCDEGAVDDCDMVFAYHCISNLPLGSAMITEGDASLAVGEYGAVIRGKGGHGGMPHLSNNPIVCGSMITNAINQIVGTEVSPMEAGIVTVGYFISGDEKARNIIPSELKLGGNLRSFSNEVQESLYVKVENIISSICDMYSCECDVEVLKGYPSIHNDKRATSVMKEALRMTGLSLIEEPFMAGEDFSYYSRIKPSCLALIGFYNESSGRKPIPHHNPDFIIDAENGIPIALEVLTNCYYTALNR